MEIEALKSDIRDFNSRLPELRRLYEDFNNRVRVHNEQAEHRQTGTFGATAFADAPQRDDPSITNTYFNAGRQDGDKHGHVKYRDNPDGSTDYFYARDVEGNEYDI
ncbi:MAG: hypothetical protein JO082_08240 [Mycobacterium sp.]|nr:hypothetical protein [Mycobacterium sp.]